MPALSLSKHFQAKILLFQGEVATDKIFWYAILMKSIAISVSMYIRSLQVRKVLVV